MAVERAQASADLARARQAFEEAAAEGGPLIASVAELRLGDTLVKIGEIRPAIDAYKRAAKAPGSRVKPDAAIRAGEHLVGEGRGDEAEELYLEVASTDPGAALGLGRMLEAIPGQESAVVAVYRAAHEVATDPPQKAALGLRFVHKLQPTDAAVVPILRQAIDDGDEATRVEAEVSLAQALMERPGADGGEIEGLLEDAAQSTIVPTRHLASILLARWLGEGDRRAEAKHLYRRLLASDDPSLSSLAAQELGALLDADGEQAEAIQVYRTIAANHSLTALSLARALRHQGKTETAIALCEIGSDPDGRDPLFAADAALLLGELLAERDRPEDAEAAYRRAIESDDLTVAPDAAIRLANLRQSRGQPKSKTLEEIVAKFDTVSALTFAELLGPQLSEAGEAESAATLYRATARTDQWAAIQLGEWLLDRGEQEIAGEVMNLADPARVRQRLDAAP